MCDMTPAYVKWHLHVWIDSFDRSQCSRVCGRFTAYMYIIHIFSMTLLVCIWDASFVCDATRFYVIWRIRSRSMLLRIFGRLAAYMCYDARSCVTWRIHVWHDAIICDMTRWIEVDAHSYAVALLHMCDMTRSCVWCESCAMPRSCVIWLVCMWHNPFDRGRCSHVCGRLAAYMCVDAFICDVTCWFVTSPIQWSEGKWGSWMVAPLWYDSFICNMTNSADLKGVSRGNYGWTATFEIPRVRIKPNSAVVVVRQPWGVARKVSIRHSHLPPPHPRWYVRHDSLDVALWMCAMCLICVMWHDSFTMWRVIACESVSFTQSCLIHSIMSHSLNHVSFTLSYVMCGIAVSCLIHSIMSHSLNRISFTSSVLIHFIIRHVWHRSFMTHSLYHVSFTCFVCATWRCLTLIYMCYMTHPVLPHV